MCAILELLRMGRPGIERATPMFCDGRLVLGFHNEHGERSVAVRSCVVVAGILVILLAGCGGTAADPDDPSGATATGGSGASSAGTAGSATTGPDATAGAAGSGATGPSAGRSAEVRREPGDSRPGQESARPPSPERARREPPRAGKRSKPYLHMPTAPIGIRVDDIDDNGYMMEQCAFISYDTSRSDSIPRGAGIKITPVLTESGVFRVSHSRCEGSTLTPCTAAGFLLTNDNTCSVRLLAAGRHGRQTELKARGALMCERGRAAECSKFVKAVNAASPRGGSSATLTQPGGSSQPSDGTED